ncbi:uncharacterized protein JN550_004511 [Neoarthrinium moseri]|uniref:uncharacterized protein n=1 Tax=Neoarthrinium moseri TaxID=1658444 RepID=UPI001FDC55F8|nr:uncharacterized protein JN550_004511 [Neoarthrinium moseri]KAI1871517.1 hypothetical protein JN550_004511 [Neoarthrinium moseri]
MSTPTGPFAALTTVFTPPCAITWLLTSSKIPSQYPPFTAGPVSCDPPSWADNLRLKGFGFYSPAICPSGFAVGPSCSITKTRIGEGFPAIQNGETAVYCVPSGYSCTTDTTDFRGGVWGMTTQANGVATNGPAIVTVGPALQIRFRDVDLDILETHPLTPGLGLTSTRTSDFDLSVSPTGGATTIRTTFAFSTPSPVLSTTTSSTTNGIEFGLPSNGFVTQTTPDPTSSSAISLVTSPTSRLNTVAASSVSSTPTASSAPASTASEVNNPTNLAAVILSASLIAIVLTVISVICLRHYRRRGGAGRGGLFLSTAFGAWIRKRFNKAGFCRSRDGSSTSNERGYVAELSGQGVVQEIAYGPAVGSKENPAELDNVDESLPTRWSWMSRVSKLWSTRSKKVSRSSIAESSSAGWTRSAASMRTSFSGHDSSGNWEAFAKEKWPDGLTVPAASHNRPLSDNPRTPKTLMKEKSSHLQIDVEALAMSRESDQSLWTPGFRVMEKETEHKYSEMSQTNMYSLQHQVLPVVVILSVLWTQYATALRIAGAFSVIEYNPLLIASQDYYNGTAQVVNGGVANLFGNSDIDLAGNAETQALRQYATHKNLRVIYTVVEVAYRIVASKKAGISSLADLKGKKIGTVPSTSAAYFVQRYLASAGGLRDSDYTTVSGGNCNTAPCGAGTLPYMLVHGSIDAVGMWEPTLELAIEGLGSDAVVFQNKSVYREVYNLYTTTDKLKNASTRKDIVAYLRALDQTAQLFTNHSETVIPRVAKTMNMNEAVLKAVWPVHDWKGGLAPDLFDVLVPEDQWVAKVDRRSGISQADLKTMIDSSVLEEARASPSTM